MHMDMWATSLPCDLLLDIFRRLGSTAVIRCAAVCRPWRRTIIDNAARCLRPRPDRFLPDLLLAFLDYSCHLRQHTTLGRLECVPSAENVLALDMESVVDVGPYDFPLASRDGFVLLKIWDDTLSKRLCLCNLLAGSCRFLPATALAMSFGNCSYVLATAYDDDPRQLPDADGVRIIAAKEKENWVTYQIFSSTSGVWGPVKRSGNLIEGDNAKVYVHTEPRQAVLCGGSVVYWLVTLTSFTSDEEEEGDYRTCLFAMDTHTERTWTTELPKEWDDSWPLVLATSEDFRQLFLIAPQSEGARHEIEVWVLAGDSRWTLQRTMDMQSWLFPYWPSRGDIWIRGFCPRSGCLFATARGQCSGSGLVQQFLIGVDGSSPRLIETTDSESCFVLQYEMDWSTYISKMKYF